MIRQGGLLTEYLSHVKADKHHFPIRNRIVASISDCIVVMETAVKGGSMITADLANGYHREVFAFPGRATDFKSAGCNWLIKNNQAALLKTRRTWLECWDGKKKAAEKSQGLLPLQLSGPEQRILDLLKERAQMHIDVSMPSAVFPTAECGAFCSDWK